MIFRFNDDFMFGSNMNFFNMMSFPGFFCGIYRYSLV